MKKLILTIALTLVLIPNISSAQNSATSDTYKFLEPVPCIEGVESGGKPCVLGTTIPKIKFDDYISYVFRFSIALSVFLAVIMIIWGGFEYMTSEIPSLKSDGKSKIWDAIIGLIMVLASYLILQTIDPRLVAVNTELPRVEIRTEDAIAFRNRLTNDLSKLAMEKQLGVNELEAQRVELEKKKRELEEKMESGQIDADSIPKYIADLENTKNQLKIVSTKQSKLIAEGLGAYNYRDANDIIHQKIQSDKSILSYVDSSKANSLVDGKYPTDTPNIIQNSYNKKINEIISTDPESARTLGLQRDFYIEQIRDEIELNNLVSTHGTETVTGSQTRGVIINNTKSLQKKLDGYIVDIDNKDKMKKSGLTETEYKNILIGKMELINAKLKK